MLNQSKCEIIGTAGSTTPTMPVTTTASIVASSLLMIAQHGFLSATAPTPRVEPENIIASIKPTPPALTKVAPENVSEI